MVGISDDMETGRASGIFTYAVDLTKMNAWAGTKILFADMSQERVLTSSSTQIEDGCKLDGAA